MVNSREKLLEQVLEIRGIGDASKRRDKAWPRLRRKFRRIKKRFQPRLRNRRLCTLRGSCLETFNRFSELSCLRGGARLSGVFVELHDLEDKSGNNGRGSDQRCKHGYPEPSGF